MKCRYCKAEIPEGELYCKKCGRFDTGVHNCRIKL